MRFADRDYSVGPPRGAAVPIHEASAGRSRLAPPLLRPVAGLLFDMGDVLYDATVWRRWLLQLLARLGLHTNYRSFYRIWDRDYLRDVHRGRRKFCEAFRTFMLSVGLSRAQIDEVEAACQARRRQLDADARPLPGVKSTITRLHAAGLVLGVLSDSEHTATLLGEQLERFGLVGVFATIVSSIDLDRTKPDPVCYLTALQEMKLRPERVAFVGHDCEELAGAAAVGMQTVAFNFDPDAEADVHITRFEELLDVVGVRLTRGAAG